MRYVAASTVTDRQTHRMTTITLVHAPRVNEGALKSVRARKNPFILPEDKGRATVVMKLKEYDCKMNESTEVPNTRL